MKRRTSLRRILPSFAVVAALLIASFINFSMPRMKRLSVFERECQALLGHQQIASAAAMPGDFREPSEVMESVNRFNAAGKDASVAYDRLLDLAQGSGLQVESITPGSAPHRSERFEVSEWTLVATGPFGAAVAFVDGLDASAALYRVASIRMVPATAGQPDDLTLTVSVESVRIGVPAVLEDVAGATRGAPSGEDRP